MPTETELLAQKLRDVVEALIDADAALESRIARLEGSIYVNPRFSDLPLAQPKKRAWWRL